MLKNENNRRMMMNEMALKQNARAFLLGVCAFLLFVIMQPTKKQNNIQMHTATINIATVILIIVTINSKVNLITVHSFTPLYL